MCRASVAIVSPAVIAQRNYRPLRCDYSFNLDRIVAGVCLGSCIAFTTPGIVVLIVTVRQDRCKSK